MKEYVDKVQIFDLIYPVGAVYISVSNLNPELVFGVGQWEQIKDTFLVAAGSDFSAGTTGGSKNHTHNYGIKYGGYYKDTIIEKNVNAGLFDYKEDGSYVLSTEKNLGNLSEIDVNASAGNTYATVSVAHYEHKASTSYQSNLPPYLSVYMWKRIE